MAADIITRTPRAEPKSFQYLGDGQVFVSLTTDDGELGYVTSATGLVRSVNLAVEMMNKNLSSFLGEIGAL
ncbi:hypothetical protein AAFX91_00220 [Bradyrhizobium sp. 31Argb]|uniref:hypothetical protein n=1 Tax=Bradyrhizobium sp. 31Argb TaxID=3141247 RepID=UPI0037493724